MILPPCSITTRSKLRNVASRWAIAITVRPRISRDKRLADRFLGFAVQRGGRFVQQQDRRILQEGARDGDALPLSAGHLDPAVADHGVHASGRVSMKSQRAAIAARSTSSSVALGRP